MGNLEKVRKITKKYEDKFSDCIKNCFKGVNKEICDLSEYSYKITTSIGTTTSDDVDVTIYIYRNGLVNQTITKDDIACCTCPFARLIGKFYCMMDISDKWDDNGSNYEKIDKSLRKEGALIIPEFIIVDRCMCLDKCPLDKFMIDCENEIKEAMNGD